MREVVESIKRVTDIMGEISAASQEQNEGIGQVQVAISQMDQTTQQNAALVEEAAAASESLREQAAKLSQTVAVFRLDAAQGRTAPAALPKPVVAPLKKKPATASKTPAEPLRVKRLASAGSGDEWEEF
jgi:methyl-accepting chemotaxis protein